MSNLSPRSAKAITRFCARGAHTDDALGEVLLEINQLGETLRCSALALSKLPRSCERSWLRSTSRFSPSIPTGVCDS